MPIATALLILTLAVEYAVATLAYPFICRRSIAQIPAVAAMIAILVVCPLTIPREQIQLRAIAVFAATDLVLRIADFARQSRAQDTVIVSWTTYCRFLNPFPSLVVVFNLRSRRLASRAAWRQDALRLSVGALLFVSALLITISSRSNSLLREHFLLDHACKLVLTLIAIESGSQFLFGLERLAGFDTTPLVNYAFLSRTPAEFWHRYNQRVRWWLTLNVFLPSGGLRAPVRGICATFLFSALLHEVAFGIATSHFDGYQALFFGLQAPAVIGSRRLERLVSSGGIAGNICARAFTVAWLAATSMLFFRGVDRVLPCFYASEPWLP